MDLTTDTEMVGHLARNISTMWIKNIPGYDTIMEDGSKVEPKKKQSGHPGVVTRSTLRLGSHRAEAKTHQNVSNSNEIR